MSNILIIIGLFCSIPNIIFLITMPFVVLIVFIEWITCKINKLCNNLDTTLSNIVEYINKNFNIVLASMLLSGFFIILGVSIEKNNTKIENIAHLSSEVY